VIARAMAKAPADRHSSAGAFRRALADAMVARAIPPSVAANGVLAPRLRRAAAALLAVGAAGAATIGSAHLLASGFGDGALPVTHVAQGDRAAVTAVPVTPAPRDTMARRLALLPPVVATAPRPAEAPDEPVRAAMVLAAGDVAPRIVSTGASATVAAAARVAVLDVAGLAPALAAALPADVRVEVLPHVETIRSFRFHVTAREVEELRRVMEGMRVEVGTAAGARVQERTRVRRMPQPRPIRTRVAPRAGGGAAAATARDAAAVVAEGPCDDTQASGAA
jgi:hypothetical protein